MPTFEHIIPLHRAIMVFDINHVKNLLQEQCDINEINSKGECAVTLCMYQNAFEILEILLFEQDYQQVNIDVQDSHGYWVIPRSKQYGFIKIYDLLCKAAAEKQKKELCRQTHFFHPLKNNDVESKEETSELYRCLKN